MGGGACLAERIEVDIHLNGHWTDVNSLVEEDVPPPPPPAPGIPMLRQLKPVTATASAAKAEGGGADLF